MNGQIEKNQTPQTSTASIGGMLNSDTLCCRQNGKAVLRDIIFRFRARANHLQTLVDMLPENPTAEQDAALWNIACGIERP